MATIPTEEELRRILHDKYMAYDKEQLVVHLVEITMVYAQRFFPSQKVVSMQDLINEVQKVRVE